MRTQDEIVARYEEIKDNDFFGSEVEEYVMFMDYEHAKPYLNDDTKKENWKPHQLEEVKSVMIDYMDFAWEKANDCRGLSASRSLSHYMAWLWVDGQEELAKSLGKYEYYGKPQLEKICQYLGLDSKQWDNGARTNVGY